MHILVVEDLKIDRFIIKRLLQSEFEVTTLSSAQEAIAFARSHFFDVAIINVLLRNDLDCIGLLRELKIIRPDNFIAIALTCYIDQPRYEKVTKAGFLEVMMKPFDKIEFQQLIFEDVRYLGVSRLVIDGKSRTPDVASKFVFSASDR